MRGRFAPSPTGPLHLGNLRTALVAWLMARQREGAFVVRMEDLDRVTSSPAHEADQLASLRSIGLDWDGDVVRQSERFGLYREAIGRLQSRDLVYECYCTRREIRLAAEAPQGSDPEGRYPGTCRRLTDQDRRSMQSAGRRPALRLMSDEREESFADAFHGTYTGRVDDFVLQRNDGVPAYNLAVVVDDAAQGVTEVVRGDDLLASTPRQIVLHRLLDLPVPRYAHVPLVLAPDGSRLAKRHGAVTLDDLAQRGPRSPEQVCARLAATLGIDVGSRAVTAAELVELFDPQRVPTTPWRLTPDELYTILEMFDDLQQLFGYQGAIDERSGVTIAGPDLLVVPCWTAEFCATLVRAAEAIGAFEPHPDDPVPGHEVSLAVISPRLFETVQEDFGVWIWPQLQSVWPYVDYYGLRDAFVIRYAPHEQESLRIHHDVAQISGSIKLNDGYSGADLVFPRQLFDNSGVGVGEMLVWPSLVTHPHETAQLDAGIKYALTVWFELPSF